MYYFFTVWRRALCAAAASFTNIRHFLIIEEILHTLRKFARQCALIQEEDDA